MKYEVRTLALPLVLTLILAACDETMLAPDDAADTIETHAPLQACFTTEPGVSEIAEGETIMLDSGCTTAATAQARYRWDLGDGRTLIGERIQIQYDQPGDFTIRLTVEDGDHRSTATRSLRVTNGGSSAGDSGPEPASIDACFTWQQVPDAAPCTIAFDASCSEGTISEYRWFFSGGPPVAGRFPDANRTTTTPETDYSWGLDTECQYFRPFERMVRLTVVDADGNTSTREQLVEFLSPF